MNGGPRGKTRQDHKSRPVAEAIARAPEFLFPRTVERFGLPNPTAWREKRQQWNRGAAGIRFGRHLV